MSKGDNIDTIPSFIFKRIAASIAKLIADLINASIREGAFPDVLKAGRVIPIFNSGSKDSSVNYRPISTLPFVSKIFERVTFQ